MRKTLNAVRCQHVMLAVLLALSSLMTGCATQPTSSTASEAKLQLPDSDWRTELNNGAWVAQRNQLQQSFWNQDFAAVEQQLTACLELRPGDLLTESGCYRLYQSFQRDITATSGLMTQWQVQFPGSYHWQIAQAMQQFSAAFTEITDFRVRSNYPQRAYYIARHHIARGLKNVEQAVQMQPDLPFAYAIGIELTTVDSAHYSEQLTNLIQQAEKTNPISYLIPEQRILTDLSKFGLKESQRLEIAAETFIHLANRGLSETQLQAYQPLYTITDLNKINNDIIDDKLIRSQFALTHHAAQGHYPAWSKWMQARLLHRQLSNQEITDQLRAEYQTQAKQLATEIAALQPDSLQLLSKLSCNCRALSPADRYVYSSQFVERFPSAWYYQYVNMLNAYNAKRYQDSHHLGLTSIMLQPGFIRAAQFVNFSADKFDPPLEKVDTTIRANLEKNLLLSFPLLERIDALALSVPDNWPLQALSQFDSELITVLQEYEHADIKAVSTWHAEKVSQAYHFTSKYRDSIKQRYEDEENFRELIDEITSKADQILLSVFATQ